MLLLISLEESEACKRDLAGMLFPELLSMPFDPEPEAEDLAMVGAL